EVATVTLPHTGIAAPILPVDRRPTEGEWDDLNKALPDQPLHLALALTGDRDPAGWWGEGRAVTWSDPIGTVREVAQALRVEIDVRTGSAAPWHPGRCAEIVAAGHPIGHAGELHPRV